MALPSRREELLAAWRALTGHADKEGWRTINVGFGGPCRLLAGRRFPGNEEALLVGFGSVRVPPAVQLPQGQGFAVSKADLGREGVARVWIALCRQSAGSLDLFAMMADDVVSTLDRLHGVDDERRFEIFLARIQAWQDFMRRADYVLGPEAELGLFGELEFLLRLISAGMPAAKGIEAWRGPLQGLQDFQFGTGAIEVKSTVSSNGFPAQVGSLEQLDDSLMQPIFVVGMRFVLDGSSLTLPQQVAKVRAILHEEPAILTAFNTLVLHAGFLDIAAADYSRRFLSIGMRTLRVDETFPRLIGANVPIQITKARYQIDLDLISGGDLDLAVAFEQLGVM